MDKINKAVKIIYIVLLAYICLVPFYYYPANYLLGFKIPLIKYFPLVCILALFLMSLQKLRIRVQQIKENRLTLGILIYFFSTLFSGIGTAYYPVSILKAIYYAATGILVYFIVSSWELTTELKLYFLRIIVFIGFLASTYGIITLLLGQDLAFGYLQYSKSNLVAPEIFLKIGRISASLGNPLFLGGLLSAVFPLSVYLYLLNKGQRKFPRFLLAGQAAVIFFGMVLTFSVAALISGIVFYLYYLVKIKNLYREAVGYKKAGIFLLCGAILCCSVLYVMTTNVSLAMQNKQPVFGQFLGKIDFQKIANIQGVALRLDSLKCAAGFFKNTRILFGIGIGKIGTGSHQFLKAALDNYFCLSLIESGILATAVLLWVFGAIIKRAVKKYENPLQAFLVLSIIVFFINMLFWDVLNQPTMRIMFWSLVGFLI